jgi:hypothetical protein
MLEGQVEVILGRPGIYMGPDLDWGRKAWYFANEKKYLVLSFKDNVLRGGVAMPRADKSFLASQIERLHP